MIRAALAAAVAVTLSILQAAAHEWYDPTCCSDRDCAPLPDGSVVATAAGWRVTVPAGGHPLLNTSFSQLVPYGSPLILRSKDEHFHGCIMHGAPEDVPRPTLLCLYVPPFGS